MIQNTIFCLDGVNSCVCRLHIHILYKNIDKHSNFKSKIHVIEIFRKCIIKAHGQKYHFENIKTNLKVIC